MMRKFITADDYRIINRCFDSADYRIDLSALWRIIMDYSFEKKDVFTVIEDARTYEDEKKWRPFTPAEFDERFKLGQVINFRRNCPGYLYKCLFIGCSWVIDEEPKDLIVYIGNHFFSLKDLFAFYEYQDENGNWHRFGVEE
jgi:hypothetical protein